MPYGLSKVLGRQACHELARHKLLAPSLQCFRSYAQHPLHLNNAFGSKIIPYRPQSAIQDASVDDAANSNQQQPSVTESIGSKTISYHLQPADQVLPATLNARQRRQGRHRPLPTIGAQISAAKNHGLLHIRRRHIEYVDYIGDVLRSHGRLDLLGFVNEQKPNLSIVSPQVGTRSSRKYSHHGPYHVPLIGLRWFLARYIDLQLCSSRSLQRQAIPQLLQHEYKAIEERGYTIEDIAVWANFILEPDAGVAVRSLAGKGTFPLPVLEFFGRRSYIPAEPLRAFLPYIRQALLHYERTSFHDPIRMIFFVRMLRKARMVSPGLFGEITDLLLDNLHVIHDPTAKQIQQRTFLLNRVLSLLALQTLIKPFESSVLQLSAMGKVLQYMSDHSPELHVSREGYRAVTRVQLRLPKTAEERHWASLKALSWPPWKQDRTAMDSELGPEHGISRAAQSMQRMAEAGFAPGAIEGVAQIYAGWEHDNTPTIQTRHNLVFNHRSSQYWRDSATWAARIDTTRTIQEAWACWLHYEEVQQDKPLSGQVILAILKKLSLEEGRKNGSAQSSALPGDGIEISAPPASIHLHTYTRTEPISTYAFFQTLKTKNVQLSISLFVQLIDSASTLQHAYEYLVYMDSRLPGISTTMTDGSAVRKQSLPAPLVAAVVRVLCRCAQVSLQRATNKTNAVSPLPSGWDRVARYSFVGQHPFVRAVWILVEAKLFKSIDWRPVLQCLAGDRLKLAYLTLLGRVHAEVKASKPASWLPCKEFRAVTLDVQAYQVCKLVVDMMDSHRVHLDPECFRMICKITARYGAALHAMFQTCESAEDKSTLQRLYRKAGLQHGIDTLHEERPDQWLATLFNKMAGRIGGENLDANDQAQDLSDSISIDASHFHCWVRALGFCGAHDAILKLVRKMSKDESLQTIHESPAESRLLERGVTALRVFLERPSFEKVSGPSPSLPYTVASPSLPAASPEIIAEVQGLVEMHFRCGWASDEDVESYRRLGERASKVDYTVL